MKRSLVAVALLAGCGDDGGGGGKVADASVDAPTPAYSDVALIPTTINRDLDILFVIDDSPSMIDKQTNLKANFGNLVNVLSSIQGGLPNLHIGVVTSDMGTRGIDESFDGPMLGSGPGACSGVGKDGALQVFSAPVTGAPYLTDVGFLGTRSRNYTGTLEDAFKAMASAGASGCGFEQTLSAMRRVFDNPANNGFSRAQARLAIIVLTDEDDCSTAHSAMFNVMNTPELGMLQSFRCTRFGVTCDEGGTTPDEMNAPGAKAKCHSNEQSAYLADIGRYKTFLSTIKSDARDVFFGVIAGAPTPFSVELRSPPGGGTAVPTLVESCSYQGGSGGEIAVPASRIADLASSVRHSSYDSVCSDLGPVMSTMGQRMKTLMGDPCLEKPIALPAECEAIDQNSTGEHRLAACTDTTTTDCFHIVEDATTCPAGQHLKLAVERSSAAPADTWTSVRCVR